MDAKYQVSMQMGIRASKYSLYSLPKSSDRAYSHFHNLMAIQLLLCRNVYRSLVVLVNGKPQGGLAHLPASHCVYMIYRPRGGLKRAPKSLFLRWWDHIILFRFTII